MKRRISLIVAMDRNRVIGAGNRLPWHLPADLKHFRSLTLGHAIVMGRKTHESIGRPLPGRANIVLTRDPRYQAPGCIVVHSASEALAAGPDCDDEIFIIGGAGLFDRFLNDAERIHATEIDAEFAGDTYFPRLAAGQWRETQRTVHAADDKNPYPYAFVIYDRVAAVRG
jgi:dihydrofolate reductase